jgi:hypothetical protein
MTMVKTLNFPLGVLSCPIQSTVTIFSFGVSVAIMLSLPVCLVVFRVPVYVFLFDVCGSVATATCWPLVRIFGFHVSSSCSIALYSSSRACLSASCFGFFIFYHLLFCSWDFIDCVFV